MIFDITTANVASLRCAAEYLEMTEIYGEGNLINRTEAFFNEVVLQSLEKSVEVLRSCESFLLLAEEVKIVNRCIDAVASRAFSERAQSNNTSRLDSNCSGRSNNTIDDAITISYKAVVEWWAEDLSALRVDLYQRVLAAMKSRGLRSESLGGSLMLYAQRALKSLNKKHGSESGSAARSKLKLHGYDSAGAKATEHEQRILLETIVSLLPVEKNIFPIKFLLGLLRTATILDTTVACRLDLERRIALQLERAYVDDLLLPAFSHVCDTLFDVDIVQRVLTTYLEHHETSQGNLSASAMYESDDLASPSQKGIAKVAKLVDLYLAEIAPDPNLKVSKFSSLVEQLPDHARLQDDGLYRAIDIFLKAHPTVTEQERKRLCKALDCQKLSQEACTHAAQNERLPVHVVVQVLYNEQIKMRHALAGSITEDGHNHRQCEAGTWSAASLSPKLDNYAGLRRENRELKLEVTRLKTRVNDLEIENSSLRQGLLTKPEVSNGSTGGFFSFFARRLVKKKPVTSKLSNGNMLLEPKAPSRRRRHSIS